MYRYEIFSLISNINSIKEYYTEYKVAKDRIFSIMDDNCFPVEQYGNVSLKNINGSIEFKNVSFGYDDKMVLKDINFNIEANDTVAIVGASGSGKSTIFNLLNKSYDVSDNSIFIDDIDINTLDRNTIRNHISIISQSPYLFNFSIKENFMLLGDHITMKDIKKACKLARIDDFIDSLPVNMILFWERVELIYREDKNKELQLLVHYLKKVKLFYLTKQLVLLIILHSVKFNHLLISFLKIIQF